MSVSQLLPPYDLQPTFAEHWISIESLVNFEPPHTAPTSNFLQNPCHKVITISKAFQVPQIKYSTIVVIIETKSTSTPTSASSKPLSCKSSVLYENLGCAVVSFLCRLGVSLGDKSEKHDVIFGISKCLTGDFPKAGSLLTPPKKPEISFNPKENSSPMAENILLSHISLGQRLFLIG